MKRRKRVDYKYYSVGEISILYEFLHGNKNRGNSLKEMKNVFIRNCFTSVLYEIVINFRTLTREYLEVKVKQRDREIYGKGFLESSDYKNIIKILFDENLDMMPLYINDPVVGKIAIWRLKIGN